MSFRRNFDAPIIAAARAGLSLVPVQRPPPPSTLPNSPVPLANRTIVIAAQPSLRAELEEFGEIKEAGDDWHINLNTKAKTDAVVALLQRHKIHGIIRRQKRFGMR